MSNGSVILIINFSLRLTSSKSTSLRPCHFWIIKRALFINCHELILRLKVAQEKQHLERVMHRYERYDLLIIDELGYLPISANEAKLLFQLINGRYERKSTIITTNVPLSSWGTVLNSTATAEAILDRLVYHSHVIKIKGKSYRLASVSS